MRTTWAAMVRSHYPRPSFSHISGDEKRTITNKNVCISPFRAGIRNFENILRDSPLSFDSMRLKNKIPSQNENDFYHQSKLFIQPHPQNKPQLTTF